MIDFKNIEGIYFVGIGGIGMSALALYFRKGNYVIGGYDRNQTTITRALEAEGCSIIYNDDFSLLPGLFGNTENKSSVLIVYTPAIPGENKIISFFRDNEYRIIKRSELLGALSEQTDTIAIAGTHGKTTVSTMTAHLLKQSKVDCSAFLGGIAKNYNSNLISGSSNFTVMEADEYDRSFHRLDPLIAVITAMDADHLEIYGDRENMIRGYNEFCSKIRKNGLLILKSDIADKIIIPANIRSFTYSISGNADYMAQNIRLPGEYFELDVKTPDGIIRNIKFPFPGRINVENLTAAIAVALNCGVTEEEIRKAVLTFRGVKRRFDIRVDIPGITYIDDYAHHPEEIRACIKSVREFFKGRKITGIFQPHLFSRTRDHATGFAEILDELDQPVLLPIYPAREKPIEGVSSQIIFEKMESPYKKLMRKEDVPDYIESVEVDVLLTIGAGDIDTLADPLTEMLKRKYRI